MATRIKNMATRIFADEALFGLFEPFVGKCGVGHVWKSEGPFARRGQFFFVTRMAVFALTVAGLGLKVGANLLKRG